MTWCNFHGCPGEQCACPTMEEYLQEENALLEAALTAIGEYIYSCEGYGDEVDNNRVWALIPAKYHPDGSTDE